MAELSQAVQADLDAMNADGLLNALIDIRRNVATLKAVDEAILDRLSQLHDAGEIDASFTHEDWSFSFCEGRRKWAYPENITALEAGLKQAKKAAEADGTATATQGASYWTVREPKS